LHKRNVANRVNIIFYFKNGIKNDIGKKKEMPQRFEFLKCNEIGKIGSNTCPKFKGTRQVDLLF
jgi:hypothetical protein